MRDEKNSSDDSSLIPDASSLSNYRLTIQYDGTDFHGWQMQDGARTVQGELTRALSLIDDRAVVLHGAGRTDAGVHAEAQVANVWLRRALTGEKLRAAVNGNVGRDVRVIAAERVDESFHARFSARGKTYCYRIFNERFASPFWSRYALAEARPLDISLMRQVTPLFLGEHDWTAFSAAQAEVRTRVRSITQLDVTERRSARGRGRLIEIHATADGFLRYMVRAIAGTLAAVGRGEMEQSRVRRSIDTGDRRLVAATAPACGLTLIEVHY